MAGRPKVKLSARDLAALNKGRPITTYPPGGGPARLTVPKIHPAKSGRRS